METQITEYSPTTAALAELRQKYAKAVFDTSTPAGMAKAIIHPLTAPVEVDKAAEWTAQMVAKIKKCQDYDAFEEA